MTIEVGTTFKGPGDKTWTVTGFFEQYALTECGKKKSCINTQLLKQHLEA